MPAAAALVAFGGGHKIPDAMCPADGVLRESWRVVSINALKVGADQHAIGQFVVGLAVGFCIVIALQGYIFTVFIVYLASQRTLIDTLPAPDIFMSGFPVLEFQVVIWHQLAPGLGQGVASAFTPEPWIAGFPAITVVGRLTLRELPQRFDFYIPKFVRWLIRGAVFRFWCIFAMTGKATILLDDAGSIETGGEQGKSWIDWKLHLPVVKCYLQIAHLIRQNLRLERLPMLRSRQLQKRQ